MDATERYEAHQADALLERVRALRASGHRLVQIGCLEVTPGAGDTAASPAAARDTGAGAPGPNDGSGDEAAGSDAGIRAPGNGPAVDTPSDSSEKVAQTTGQRFEIIYSFDQNFVLSHLRLSLAADDHVPSISGIYDMAFLYENEIHDLFGIHIDNMSLDFQGTFYQKQVARPFCSVDATRQAIG